MLASKYGHHKAQCTRVFPRLFSLNFDWLVELFSIVLIGHRRYLRMVLQQSIKNS